MAIAGYQLHEYEPSTACTNFLGAPAELPEGEDGCMHRQYRTAHCAWCGCAQDTPWHRTDR